MLTEAGLRGGRLPGSHPYPSGSRGHRRVTGSRSSERVSVTRDGSSATRSARLSRRRRPGGNRAGELGQRGQRLGASAGRLRRPHPGLGLLARLRLDEQVDAAAGAVGEPGVQHDARGRPRRAARCPRRAPAGPARTGRPASRRIRCSTGTRASWVRPADGPRTKVQPSGGRDVADPGLVAGDAHDLDPAGRPRAAGAEGDHPVVGDAQQRSDRPERLDLRLQAGPHQPGRPAPAPASTSPAPAGWVMHQRPGPGGGQQPLRRPGRRHRSRGTARRRSTPPVAISTSTRSPPRRTRARPKVAAADTTASRRSERPKRGRPGSTRTSSPSATPSTGPARPGPAAPCRAATASGRAARRAGGRRAAGHRAPARPSPASSIRSPCRATRSGSGSAGSAVAVSVGSGSEDRSSAVSRPARDRPNSREPDGHDDREPPYPRGEAAGALRLLPLLHDIGHGRSIAGTRGSSVGQTRPRLAARAAERRPVHERLAADRRAAAAGTARRSGRRRAATGRSSRCRR